MRDPKKPTMQEMAEIAELLEHALSHPISAEALSNLRQTNQSALDDIVEANTISVLGMSLFVLFEVHDGELFQRVRICPLDGSQPSYELCLDILPHLGMLRDMRSWSASWPEVLYPSEEDGNEPKYAYNISQLVVPHGITKH